MVRKQKCNNLKSNILMWRGSCFCARTKDIFVRKRSELNPDIGIFSLDVFSFQFWNIDFFFFCFFRVFIFSFLVKTTILAWADNIFINYNTDSWNFYCVVVNLKTIFSWFSNSASYACMVFPPLCKITACRLLPHKHKFVLANDKWWFRWVFKGKTPVDIHCWTIFFHK